MSCDELLRRLTEYEDGVLPADFCQALEIHMRDCPPCAELRRDLQTLSALCRQGVKQPAMPQALRDRLRGYLRDNS
jgi:anti-sigma factor (TIGR02949 family)